MQQEQVPPNHVINVSRTPRFGTVVPLHSKKIYLDKSVMLFCAKQLRTGCNQLPVPGQAKKWALLWQQVFLNMHKLHSQGSVSCVSRLPQWHGC